MTIIKKRVITIETRQRIVIRQTPRRTFWCEFCAARVDVSTPERAAVRLATNQREIFKRIESGSLHFAEDANGSVFICVNSLKNI